MSLKKKNTRARLRITRRLGDLPGLTTKTSKRAQGPGQHGQTRQKQSQFRIRLQAKQKLRFNYGVNERMLRRYVHKARRSAGSTGVILLQLLEMRLDNIVFRLGLTPSIRAARQFISHGHIVVNDRKINCPSYQCRVNDLISIATQTRSQRVVQSFQRESAGQNVPSFLKFDTAKMCGKVQALAQRHEVGVELNELLVIEFYSR
uniref:Small ribosomal subunit protein uS4c n=1 Tax=Pseudobryopsis hainanensis TaxID=2320808 RepID=A0A386AXV4_9CHLO|nr:ribosomal protein S4 [Pseudobryopsis hainanensis]